MAKNNWYWCKGLEEEHKANYDAMVEVYGMEDREYAVAFYILSHPDIHHKVKYRKSEPPFYFVSEISYMSSAFEKLVDLGEHLFTGNDKVDLSRTFATLDSNNTEIAMQAINIYVRGVV